jgi:serine/threonine-protein kinase
MNAARWEEIHVAFDKLVELDLPDRNAHLAMLANTDPELHRALEALLKSDAAVSAQLAPIDAAFLPPTGRQADPLGLTGRTISHFEVREALGAGGMGVVYRANDTRLGRVVALKFLLPHYNLDASAKARFLREAHAAAALDHPNLCTIHEVGTSDEGCLFLAMALYPGETLRDRLARNGSIPLREALDIAPQIVQGLQAAHAAGIVHRDLKPGNVMLLPDGTVRILDFGLAKARDHSRSETGVRFGTVSYMSPEQIRGGNVDGRSDLWSLGVVFYEMLTRRKPFAGDEELAIAHAILHDEPDSLSMHRDEIPAVLEDVVQRLLQKDPVNRYDSASELLREFGRIRPLTIESPETRQGILPTLRGLARKSSQKRSRNGVQRGTMITLAFATILVLISASSVYWYHHRQVTTRPSLDSSPSLAVLPFDNLGAPEDAYFADGMTDEIRNRLGSLPGLRLVGRQSAQLYAKSQKPVQQIGQELGVEYLLTGTVRWERSNGGSVVRVSPTLIRASDGIQLWAEPSQDQWTGIFKIQSDVAERVARQLQVQLRYADLGRLAAVPTENLAAYDDYLRGRREFDRDRPTEAIAFFERAVNADPKFALARAYLGRAFVELNWIAGFDSLADARREIDSALALNPSLSEGHAALGDFYYHGQLDYAKATSEFAEAERLAPNDSDPVEWGGYVERRQGKWIESLRDLRRADALDPRRVGIKTGIADVLQWLRRYDESDEWNRQALAIDSTWILAHTLQISNAVNRGNADSALKVIRRVVQKLDSTDRHFVWQYAWLIRGDRRLRSRVRLAGSDNSNDSVNYYRAIATMAYAEGDQRAVLRAADSVIALSSRRLRFIMDSSGVAGTSGDLAAGYAFRGHKQQTLEVSRKISFIGRVAKDSMRKLRTLDEFAHNAAIAGANDEAIDAFRQLLGTEFPESRAALRIDPTLAGLRRDPRFLSLIAEPRAMR